MQDLFMVLNDLRVKSARAQRLTEIVLLNRNIDRIKRRKLVESLHRINEAADHAMQLVSRERHT